MWIIAIFLIGCISGCILFGKKQLDGHVYCDDSGVSARKISVIIPARNEERNLPYILSSLYKQTMKPEEIIIVDDFSTDRTREVALGYGVKVIQNTELPEGWTGKNWAVWNGYLNASGDIFVFLDADVRLAPHAIEVLLKTRKKSGGVISVVPYHDTEKFYERLSLVPCILGLLSFTSPYESKNRDKGLYGPCIVVTREDYEKVKGHSSIRYELLDDLNLGRVFTNAGIPVENFLGCDVVSFRMYPMGIQSELEGFAKGAVLSTASLNPFTIVFIALWALGLIAVGFITPIMIALRHSWALPFVIGYSVYTVQILYFLRYTGHYGRWMPFLHFLSSLFFIIVMLYSSYQVLLIGHVSWRGRVVKIRR